jgi:hypothetical protein
MHELAEIQAGLEDGLKRLDRVKPKPNPERDRRVAKTTADLWEFRFTYLPHLFRVEPAPYHVADEKAIEKHELFAAGDPRYHAKTTRHTLSRPLWEAVTKRVRYIIIIRDDEQHVKESILSIRRELELNELLRSDYGDMTEGQPWTQTQLVLANGVKILGLTKGQPIPGALWDGVRVQRVYIDDPQTIEDVQSETRRRKDQEWLDNDVLPAREQGGKVVMCQNTIHPDCLIEYFRKKPRVCSRKYDAIASEPKRLDLWDAWEKIMTDPHRSLDQRTKAAGEFYQAHLNEMMAGAKTLWPEMWGFLPLMNQKLDLGSIVFFVQFRNRPFTGDRAKWVARYTEIPERAGRYEGFDLATRAGRDWFARVQIAVDDDGKVFVLDAFRDHLSFSAQYAMVTETPHELVVARGVESNAYQAVLADEAARHSLAGGATIVPLHSSLPAELRCIKIWRLMENGKLLFGNGPAMDELVEQATGWRDGQHLPDMLSALELALRVALARSQGTAFVLLGDIMP